MPVEAPRPARHLEVERKFDVIESTVSPSFEGIAAVVRVEQSPTQQLGIGGPIRGDQFQFPF
ncbi:hypothetical protein ABLO07_17790, partial [Mycobacterium tuberculosis]